MISFTSVIKFPALYRFSGIIALILAVVIAQFLFRQTIEILSGMNPAAKDLHSTAFFIYTFPLLVGITTGILQFFPALYRRFPLVHFIVGNLYVLVVLLAVAPMGLLLSIFRSGDEFSAFSFALLHFVLWKQTRISVSFIVDKDLLSHLKGMIKSYLLLLCSAASILQSMCFPAVHLEFYWIFILIFAEYLLSTGFSVWLLKRYLLQ